jgi:hypothetical protein
VFFMSLQKYQAQVALRCNYGLSAGPQAVLYIEGR